MSSLNFKKLKQTDLKPLLRHCDKYVRPRADHSNIHINKEMTNKNMQLKRSYDETCKLFDDTIAELDQRPKANHRVDRVVAYAIEGPLPMPVDEDIEKNKKMSIEWINGILTILKEEYPEMVVLQEYIHYDEIHEYLNPETGEYVMSRPHLHLFVMPVVNEKLNSKQFFPNKKSFFDFNAKLDELTISIYGRTYGDGSKKKSFSKVEQLKIASEKAELEERRKAAQEKEKILINIETALRCQEQIFEEREKKLNQREAKMMSFMESAIGKKAIQEYNATMQNNETVQVRHGKRNGKISVSQREDFQLL